MYNSIAFLGWGSLIWDPRNLRTKSDWYNDGPILPIEYKRISSDGRITLVIHPNSVGIKTLWTLADFEKLDDARENLRLRENTPNIDRIGYLSIIENTSNSFSNNVLKTIEKWAKEKNLDAVVWTDLAENPNKFRTKTKNKMTDDNIINYLNSLDGKELEDARRYIQNTPKQIDTPLRRRIIQELNW